MPLNIFIFFFILSEIIYILLCIALYKLQNRLIFSPQAIVEITPEDLGIPYEDVWLEVKNTSEESEKFHGWWLPNSNSSNVLLYLHGNGANIGSNLGIAKNYYKLGFSILMIDYRGYGMSESKFPTEARVYKDAQVAWDYLVETRGFKAKQIFIYGHSLGGAIAIDLSVRKPQSAGLIVESSFTSIENVVSYYGGIYRFFPIRLVLNQRFDSLSKVPLLKTPILFIHGSEDKIVPDYMSEELYKATTSPKQLKIIPEAGHNDIASVAREEYLTTVKDFLVLVKGLAASSN